MKSPSTDTLQADDKCALLFSLDHLFRRSCPCPTFISQALPLQCALTHFQIPVTEFLGWGISSELGWGAASSWRISSHPQARAGKSWYTKHPVAWPSGEVTPRCFLRFLYGIQLWSLTVTWQLIFYQLSFLSSRPYPCSLHLPNKDILESALRFTPGIIQTLNTLLWNLCLLHTSVILKRKG